MLGFCAVISFYGAKYAGLSGATGQQGGSAARQLLCDGWSVRALTRDLSGAAAKTLMFGWNRIEHDLRYELADEFLKVLHYLWSETGNFSYKGRSSWKLSDARSELDAFSRRDIISRPNRTGWARGCRSAGRSSMPMATDCGRSSNAARNDVPLHRAGG